MLVPKVFPQTGDQLNLGQFSISLSVQNLTTSKDFYETLGFTSLGGDVERNYLIMKQVDTRIGLFQGMFKHNILTFNPDWNSSAENDDLFDDVRNLKAQFERDGIDVDLQKFETNGIGPDHFIFWHPDSNLITVVKQS